MTTRITCRFGYSRKSHAPWHRGHFCQQDLCRQCWWFYRGGRSGWAYFLTERLQYPISWKEKGARWGKRTNKQTKNSHDASKLVSFCGGVRRTMRNIDTAISIENWYCKATYIHCLVGSDSAGCRCEIMRGGSIVSYFTYLVLGWLAGVCVRCAECGVGRVVGGRWSFLLDRVGRSWSLSFWSLLALPIPLYIRKS